MSKMNGALRFCFGVHHLNQLTVPDCYSLPHIDLTLNVLSGYRWFSCFDLKSVYWEVPSSVGHMKNTYSVWQNLIPQDTVGLPNWQIIASL